MQTQFSFFPEGTKLINASTGFRISDGMVYYLHNGDPIFCHKTEDKRGRRFILANLIESGLCEAGELSRALGLPHRNVNRYHKKYREQGAASFYEKKFDRRGNCYQLTEDKMQKVQELLNQNYSNVKAAEAVGVSECAIRYHLKKGTLKKKKKRLPLLSPSHQVVRHK